ncbi:hypothetical protein DRQ50_05695 [bacterium]|nr:MAG: hypothetical protein DRQ50_05695 [bacterium]
MSEQTVVRVRGLSKYYGTIVGVLGPNGSGKTTLMGQVHSMSIDPSGDSMATGFE